MQVHLYHILSIYARQRPARNSTMHPPFGANVWSNVHSRLPPIREGTSGRRSSWGFRMGFARSVYGIGRWNFSKVATYCTKHTNGRVALSAALPKHSNGRVALSAALPNFSKVATYCTKHTNGREALLGHSPFGRAALEILQSQLSIQFSIQNDCGVTFDRFQQAKCC